MLHTVQISETAYNYLIHLIDNGEFSTLSDAASGVIEYRALLAGMGVKDPLEFPEGRADAVYRGEPYQQSDTPTDDISDEEAEKRLDTIYRALGYREPEPDTEGDTDA